MGEEDKWEEF